MTYSDYAINALLTNGDIFTIRYATPESAQIGWAKLERNPLVVHASLHDQNDAEIATLPLNTAEQRAERKAKLAGQKAAAAYLAGDSLG